MTRAGLAGFAIAFVCHAAPALAASERLIGLLDLPEVVGEGCGRNQPVAIALHAARAGSKPIGSVEMEVTHRDEKGTCDDARLVIRRGTVVEPLPYLESGYEVPAAIVHERSGLWYRIELKRGSAWIRHDDPKDFHSYPVGVREQLGYIPRGWDRKLWRTPGDGDGSSVAAVWKRHY